MNQEPDNRDSVLYEALQRVDANERKTYLDQACGTDTPLRMEIDSLLGAYESDEGVLDIPVGLFDQASEPVYESPGTVIGRYKLLEKIGEGGMAVVYMAEQEKPIRRKVALKIIKLGMDTKRVIARFEAERQALALMDHPNIAKVLDAGATETGRPYFVMELVQGVSMTEYCDQNNLRTEDRLKLFVQICNAVQHAHHKGIIHRDIKPSNVMVTQHDGEPGPKVIDFGIAKAINQRLTEKTLFTRYAHIIGTPVYMSPEQAELSVSEVDARTDIYSLGVLLYELLTGTTPFGEERLHKAGYVQMQRIIREEEPTRPSSKIETSESTLAHIAEYRATTPSVLKKLLQHDLDWIVMKCLEKDRAGRYETATALSLDIERHLGDEPVSAGPPNVTYRMHKFIRRNRFAVITFFLVAGALAIGATAATIAAWNSRALVGKVEHATGMVQRHVWDAPPASDLLGGISRDGRTLSYVDWTAGNLAVYDLTENVNWLVTKNTDPTWKTSDGSNENSVVSPDGKQIAYSWRNHTDPQFYDLRIIDTDGDNLRVLYRDAAAVSYVRPYDFSTDGKKILAYFCDANKSLVDEKTGTRYGKGHLVLISAVDGSVRTLKTWHRRGKPKKAIISPDGRYVVYDFEQDDEHIAHDIFMIDLNSAGEIALIEHPANDRLCGWTPDGRRIVFSSDRSSNRDLWMIEVSDDEALGQPRKLLGSFEGWPIGFTTHGSFYYGIGTAVSNVYIARLDSTGLSFKGEPKLVSSQFVGTTAMADWSPDGKFLAYRASGGVGVGPLVVYSVTTSQERMISTSPSLHPNTRMYGLRWSPNGLSLLVCGTGQEDGYGLYTVSVETGITTLITSIPNGRMRYAVWSPDSTSIYTRSPGHLNRLDPATGRETELCQAEGGTIDFDVSPDGRWLAFFRDQTSLVVLPSTGGEPHPVVHPDDNEVNNDPGNSFVRWTPDGESLLYDKHHNELWKVNIETREQQQIGPEIEGLVNASMHPDGRQITFAVRHRGSALWVMENFLPD